MESGRSFMLPGCGDFVGEKAQSIFGLGNNCRRCRDGFWRPGRYAGWWEDLCLTESLLVFEPNVIQDPELRFPQQPESNNWEMLYGYNACHVRSLTRNHDRPAIPVTMPKLW